MKMDISQEDRAEIGKLFESLNEDGITDIIIGPIKDGVINITYGYKGHTYRCFKSYRENDSLANHLKMIAFGLSAVKTLKE